MVREEDGPRSGLGGGDGTGMGSLVGDQDRSPGREVFVCGLLPPWSGEGKRCWISWCQ